MIRYDNLEEGSWGTHDCQSDLGDNTEVPEDFGESFLFLFF